MTEWFADWFGETYLQLYPHRDEQDARRALSLIAGVIALRGARVLDLACGEGRHLVQLEDMGAQAIGIDLSRVLLHRARTTRSRPPLVVRGDMRLLPFRLGTFDVVVNLFTSFGYFASDHEHEGVLQGISDLLGSGGWFVLDFLNASQVRRCLVPHEERQTEKGIVEIEKRLVHDGAYVEKEIHLKGDGSRHLERVRLFSADELRTMLSRVGLRPIHDYGDYDGGPITDESPRVILFARKV